MTIASKPRKADNATITLLGSNIFQMRYILGPWGKGFTGGAWTEASSTTATLGPYSSVLTPYGAVTAGGLYFALVVLG